MTGAPRGDGVRIAVAGAGLIGRRHIEEVAASSPARLAAVVDPAPAADGVAEVHGVPRYRSLAELLSARTGRPVDLPGPAASRPRLGVSPPT